MDLYAPLGLLLLVTFVVAFVALWTPHPKPLPVPPPTLAEIPILNELGTPIVREVADREAAMRDALVGAKVIAAREWERTRPEFLLIHDDLNDEDLVAMLQRAGLSEASVDEERGDEERGEDGETLPLPTNARERFRRALDVAPSSVGIERLGTHFAPGPFDAYRIRPGARR